jgi:sugar phosphate isomerase/epimerase
MKRSDITRRQFLLDTACAAAGLAAAASCVPLAKLTKSPKGFKLAVCDWTIGKGANPASLEAARRIGLDGVQVDFGGGQDKLPLCNPDLQKRFLEEAKKHDMQIASLAMGVLNGVPYKSDPRAERWVADSVDVCKAMGVRVVLLAFFGDGDVKNDQKGLDTVVSRLKKVAPKAEKAGVTFGFESWLSAEQHLEVINRVGSPAVKVYYDVGNSQKAGYDIYKEIRLLGKNICEIHAKDYDGVLGKGSIDFNKVRQAIDDIGYRGWIVIESVKTPLGAEETVRQDGLYLRQIFPPKV